MLAEFGKYKDQHLTDIIINDPAYAVWYANQCKLDRPNHYYFIAATLDCDAYWFSFGKYKGQSINQVNDKHYFKWLSEQDGIAERNPRLYKAITDKLNA